MVPKEVVGRGLCLMEKRILEFQVAIFGDHEKEAKRIAELKEAERSAQLKDYIDNRNNECSSKATMIPMVPEKLLLSETMSNNISSFRKHGILPIGMDFSTVSLSEINISVCGFLGLLGEQESKDRFVSNMIKMISQTAIFHNIEAYIIDDKNKKLKENKEDKSSLQKKGSFVAMFSDAFAEDERRTKWEEWEKYYFERNRRRMPATTAHRQIKELLKLTPEQMSKVIDFSIDRGYQGLFYDRALKKPEVILRPSEKDFTGI
jgi:hypothetical protein